MSRRIALAALLATLVCGALAGPAAAKVRQASGLHNARYCEIFELQGMPPQARVLVWNTIGLNRCPAGWWQSLDAAEIAEQRDDTMVLFNGPRHFLMDSARGRTGAVADFDGQKLRRVATVSIRDAADLAQTPYAERRIARTNTWHWKAGRRVFELLAPNGPSYLMQSYSQIVDPALRAADLRRLGRRLDLPAGWRYRMRRLRQPLTLRAQGSATTIIQDDLKNTYQRLPRTDRGRHQHRVELTATTASTGSPAPGTIEDRGTIAGKPFGVGTIEVLATFAPEQRMSGSFTIRTKRGSAFGTVDTSYVISGNEIDFIGTATFTGGTRRYRGITGKRLAVHDHNTLDGQNGRITLDGNARF